ncbi:MAG: uroporphyrinogen-III C-methyltransferase, partial [Thiobacillaceae bacterium]
GKPQFAGLREAIGRDIARLKLLPAADIPGINARLDVLVQNVDRLRLVVEPGPTHSPPPQPSGGDRWQRLWQSMVAELKQLVRVQRLDKPDVALLPPEQAWFLRENLKLRLLAARLAMLNRDEAAYRAELGMAQSWVERHFDTRDPLTQSLLASLKELAALPVAQQEADLSESLEALRGMPFKAEAAGG